MSKGGKIALGITAAVVLTIVCIWGVRGFLVMLFVLAVLSALGCLYEIPNLHGFKHLLSILGGLAICCGIAAGCAYCIDDIDQYKKEKKELESIHSSDRGFVNDVAYAVRKLDSHMKEHPVSIYNKERKQIKAQLLSNGDVREQYEKIKDQE